MKFLLILLLTCTTTFSFGQTNNFIDTNKYSIQVNQAFSSVENYSWFTNYLDTTKNCFDFLIGTSGLTKNLYDNEFYFIRLNKNYDTLLKRNAVFKYPVESIIKTNNCFFVVHSDKSTTMGIPSRAFLAKYNTKCERIWIKNINKDISPDDNIVMTINDKNELLIFSTTYSRKTKKNYRVTEKRDQNGNLIKSIMTKQILSWIPDNITKTLDNNFLLTCTLFNVEKQKNSLYLMKLNQDGDTIWTKIYSDIYPTQTLIKRNGECVIYGRNYDRIQEDSDGYFKNNLKVLLLDKDGNFIWEKTFIKTDISMPGSVIETKENSLIFSSVINPKLGWVQKNYVFELNNNGDLIYEKVIDTIPTSTKSLVFNNSNSFNLTNTAFHSDSYRAHNCSIQFLTLTKKE